MKKVLVLVLFAMLFVSSVKAEELPKPGMLPDHPFYGLKRLVERLRLWITFDNEEKVKLRLYYAELRLAELNETIVLGKIQYVAKLKRDYETEINETENEINRSLSLGRNVTALAEYVSAMTYKHILVLQRILEKAPEQAKPAIEHAINVSLQGHLRATERIMAKINQTLEKIKALNCTTDADCRELICPMVVGNDTPVCINTRCKCGAKWQIINITEWKERFKEEWTARRAGELSKMREILQIRQLVVTEVTRPTG